MVVTAPPSLPVTTALACLIRGASLTLCIQDSYPEILVAVGASKPDSSFVKFANLVNRWVYKHVSNIIVMGRDVRVATVAVAQGNLTVSISESAQVSQPNPLARGRTVVTPNSSVTVTADGQKFALVKDGVSLQQLVDGLNGPGIGPSDLLSILQAIKAQDTDRAVALMGEHLTTAAQSIVEYVSGLGGALAPGPTDGAQGLLP